MGDWPGIDWGNYFHRLSDDEIGELAMWLAAEDLAVGEFTDLLDRLSRRAADEWRGRSLALVASCGHAMVEEYARRKRRYVELLAALEEAQMSGALPGEVAPKELQPLPRAAPRRTAEELLQVLERARSGSG
jgi:hypothetical protein